MTGSFWLDLALGVGAALLLAWLALVAGLILVRPRGGLLREALRHARFVARVLELDRELDAYPFSQDAVSDALTVADRLAQAGSVPNVM